MNLGWFAVLGVLEAVFFFVIGWLAAAHNQQRLDADYGNFCKHRKEFLEWLDSNVWDGFIK